ncbi:hypothetical protein HHI36_013561 [Cryptolaemus montrouzieri]|uniref:Phenoloxidase-activating factor 2 n=1 Tax=Cryptolaemus montrouzieri TaxID=559131 RepID=A0ABD2NIG8_9CUCU
MLRTLVLCLSVFVVIGAKNVRPVELMADPCQCVPHQMCIDNDFAVDGQGLLDIRIDGECEDPDHICCDNVIEPPVPPAVQSLFSSCGFETPIQPRILGEQIIIFGEVPWTTAILRRDAERKLNIFKCGSSLIHPQVVLTAAHCVFGYDIKTLSVRAGEVDAEDTTEALPHQEHKVKEVVIHKNFNPNSLRNDIALVILSDPFMLSGNVRVVCLPTQQLNLISTSCRASGWGSDSFKNGKHSSKLKKIDLPLISRSKCLFQLRQTRLGPFFSLHRSFICAGGERGADTCTGDGGSPLVCPIEGHSDRFVQMGIVSWGIGCGNESPGVYVNVNLFASWIDEQLMKRQFDTTVYKYK